MSYAEAAALTVPHVRNALGNDAAGVPVAMKGEGQKAAERLEVFDRICTTHGLTPGMLATLAPATVCGYVKQLTGHAPDARFLPGWLQEYSRQRGGLRS